MAPKKQKKKKMRTTTTTNNNEGSEDQVFEIVDYTAATPWEKELLSIEDTIRKWRPTILIDGLQDKIRFFGNGPNIGFDILQTTTISSRFKLYAFISLDFTNNQDSEHSHPVNRNHKLFVKINELFGVSSFFLIEETSETKNGQKIENLLSNLNISIANIKELSNFPIFAKKGAQILGKSFESSSRIKKFSTEILEKQVLDNSCVSKNDIFMLKLSQQKERISTTHFEIKTKKTLEFNFLEIPEWKSKILKKILNLAPIFYLDWGTTQNPIRNLKFCSENEKKFELNLNLKQKSEFEAEMTKFLRKIFKFLNFENSEKNCEKKEEIMKLVQKIFIFESVSKNGIFGNTKAGTLFSLFAVQIGFLDNFEGKFFSGFLCFWKRLTYLSRKIRCGFLFGICEKNDFDENYGK